MSNFSNPRFIHALARKPVDRPPIWIMRQAGRYMPEYRKIRAEVSDFLQLCKTPELACQVTMLPIDRFGFDAAILFSDILMIPEAMHLDLKFVKNGGPKFGKTITSHNDVNKLPDLDPDIDMPYISAAVRLIKQELSQRIPLIGFAGSPWTVATYMVEGETSKQHNKVRAMMYQDPQAMHKLLEHLSKQTIKYLQAQIKAGVDCVMLFDTWGGILDEQKYKEFSLQYMQRIVHAIDIPTILFTKNGGRYLSSLASTGCAGIGLDWIADLAQAKKEVGDQVALQGNLDPAVLYASPDVIKQHADKILNVYGSDPGFIFNLGHGIAPDIPVEHVHALVEQVKNYNKLAV